MFTGLIAETGTVLSFEERPGAARLRVSAPELAAKLQTGDSIAVSGVCLTALNIGEGSFEADLAGETVARTSLSRLSPASVVNLELPTPAGNPLGGHVVQGHVDAVGKLMALDAVYQSTPEHTDWLLRVAVPPSLARYVVEKGSITIEGISLTVAATDRRSDGGLDVTAAIIPHTYRATNLHTLRPGDEVNLEADVLAKYAEQRANLSVSAPVEKLTELTLIANGF